MGKKKALKEEFAKFFADPSRESFRELMKNNLGETNYCDFKQEWLSDDETAKHILGFANSGGGCIVVGVGQDESNKLVATGLENVTDATEIQRGVNRYVPRELEWDVLSLQYEASEYGDLEGKSFQVLIVEDTPELLPFLSLAESTNIKRHRVYVRRDTSTDEATHADLQEVINRRIDSGHSSAKERSLMEHLRELKVLYSHIEPRIPSGIWGLALNMRSLDLPNPKYPKEDYESFVSRLIDLKKKQIERLLTA